MRTRLRLHLLAVSKGLGTTRGGFCSRGFR